MRIRSRDTLLVALCAVLLVALSIIVLRSQDGGRDKKTSDDPSQTGDPAASGSTSGSSAGPSSSAKSDKKKDPSLPNFEITKLAPGEVPPQFIIFSFDGAGSTEKWASFSEAAAKVNARFTGFLTGIYLVPDAVKTTYQGPGHSPGKSSVGFGGTADEVAATVTALNNGKAAGHEIGTHFNGHFCAGAEPSGKDWTTDQWNSELDQFFNFLTNYQAIGSVPDPKLTVVPTDIKGERTPCLEGKPEVFFPALLAHGMTYDSSLVSNGIVWPTLVNGIWEFWMPSVRIPALNKSNIAMDYNFWVTFNNGKDEPARAGEFTAMVLDTYRSMLTAAQSGNHAPLVIGNHFNNWSGNAFNPAIEQFMLESCKQPGVVCTTYQHVLEWMSAQDPAVLQVLLDSPPTYN